jgi:hypothetical protein
MRTASLLSNGRRVRLFYGDPCTMSRVAEAATIDCQRLVEPYLE